VCVIARHNVPFKSHMSNLRSLFMRYLSNLDQNVFARGLVKITIHLLSNKYGCDIILRKVLF
jgi:hypothetical protein